jgi:O-glycosyl hydrolase
VLVITNSGDAQTVTLKQGNKAAELALPSASVMTLLWK